MRVYRILFSGDITPPDDLNANFLCFGRFESFQTNWNRCIKPIIRSYIKSKIDNVDERWIRLVDFGYVMVGDEHVAFIEEVKDHSELIKHTLWREEKSIWENT